MTEDFKSYYFDLIRHYFKAIPNWVKYIAVDANGYVYGYSKTPKRNKQDAKWVMLSADNSVAKYIFSITMAYPIDWENTLIDLKKFAKKEYIKQIKEHINAFPDWVKYVVMDNQGYVSGYEHKPEIDGLSWKASARCGVVFQMIEFANYVYFADTLVNIKDIITRKNNMSRKITKNTESKSVLRFKVWQPANTFLVYQILEAENIPDDTNYKYTSVDMEYDLLHPEKVVKNYEGIEVFSSKEDRYAYINKMTKNLKELFSKDEKVKATEKDIGKNVETDCGVAKLEALTTNGKYVVTFNGESRLFMVDNAWFNVKSDCDFNILAIPGSSAEYYFAR